MDAGRVAGENWTVGRYRHKVFEIARTPRYCVVFNLQWQVLASEKFAPGANLSAAMTSAIERLTREGWHAESGHEFGFVFLHRDAERRLLILTERDPYDVRPQSFSPFARQAL